MELEQFKSELNRLLSAPDDHKTTTEMEQMLRGRSQSALDKIRRNMWLEIVFGVVLIGGVGVAGWAYSSTLIRVLAAFAMAFTAVQAVGFWVYEKKIYREKMPVSLREQLSRQIEQVNAFIKMYFRFSLVVFVGGLVLGANMGYQIALKQINDPLEPFLASISGRLWFTIPLALAMIALGWWIIRWWIQFAYGQYGAELRRCLAELDQA